MRTQLRKNGMDLLELESAKHRLLSIPRSCAYDGMDSVSFGCSGFGKTLQIRIRQMTLISKNLRAWD